MCWEEDAVLNFLKGNPEAFYNRKEISKKAVKRRIFEEDPNWAVPALASLLNQKLIEKDDSGLFRYKKPY